MSSITTNLVILENQIPVTTSLKVAEVFNKEHNKVCLSIEKIIKDVQMASDQAGATFGVSAMFQKTEYKDVSGKSNKMYYLNRDGLTMLIMGFNNTPKVIEWKLKYIDAFNRMEEYIRQQQNNAINLPTSTTDMFLMAGQILKDHEQQLKDHTAHLQLQDAEIKKIADFMYDLSETHRKRVDELQDRITQLAKSQEPPYPMPDLVETTKLQMRVYNICSWYYKKDPSITMQQYVDGFNETLTAWLKNRYNIIPAAELFKLRQAYVAVSAVGGTQQSDNISLCHLVTTNRDWLKTAHELCFSLETYYRAQYKN